MTAFKVGRVYNNGFDNKVKIVAEEEGFLFGYNITLKQPEVFFPSGVNAYVFITKRNLIPPKPREVWATIHKKSKESFHVFDKHPGKTVDYETYDLVKFREVFEDDSN